MPAALKSRDRAFLILVGLLLAAMTALGMLSGDAREAFPRFSSYSADPNGAKAAYLLLAEMGHATSRWERGFAELEDEPENTLLIIADPFEPESKIALQEEKDALSTFLKRGGRILATGDEAATMLPGAVAQKSAKINEKPTLFSAVLPTRLTWRAPAIELERPQKWTSRDGNETNHYADAHGAPAVVSYAVGKGEAIWWADSYPLSNEGLPRASNMRLLLNCAGDSTTRVLWDEHLHGERPSLAHYVQRTPILWLLAQFLLIFAATLFTFSRRHGPVEPLRPGASRLSPLEFVETLGDLYRRKGAAPGSARNGLAAFPLSSHAASRIAAGVECGVAGVGGWRTMVVARRRVSRYAPSV